ncbi:hypothetical protein HYH02_008328 [Chlamydomonas schloesseri]|uniref:Uncharacterized protein n=1 Tax=Chlamydomonas schloesseri TaxID=2026947 RepID=A0A836B409_9CHLO|nr:hypothetical protein HYH02_008328 [Chlamydomonas schloesseri]|eukprot:KAG2446768.1 hypothetical protein HYH02_008328 [Chlamydomonas schloesseri]
MSVCAAFSRTLGRASGVPSSSPRPSRVTPAACCAHAWSAAASGSDSGSGSAGRSGPPHVSHSQILRTAGRMLLLGAAQLPAAGAPRSASAFAGASGGGGALVRQVAAMSTPAGAAAAAGGSSPTGAIVVYVTVPSAEVGEALAGKLVEAKLAACVNILPGLTSVYFWDGKVNKDPELLLIIKSREELLGELTSFVRANHPYDEPEVIGLPILGGSPSYLQWLMDNTDRKAAAAAAAAAEKQ